MKEAYIPISCSFYDRLEAAATLKKPVALQFLDQADMVTTITTRIRTILTRDKVEYLVLENDFLVRLDKIQALDGVQLKDHC